MGSFDNVTLLYSHPHISIYIEDNTGYTEKTVDNSAKEFNGIQVGFFGSGRDNTLLYCTNTDEYLNEYSDPNFKLYGQAGYNAYNALDTKYAGMYILRLMPDNATYANTVILAKYKLIDDTTITPSITGNNVMELIGTNPIQELIPDEEDGGTADSSVFTLTGTVVSGLTGDANIDALFSHITPEWLNGNNLGKFSVATVKIPKPETVVGESITITQTSSALKKFYSDFGMDAEHIKANTDRETATKTRTYETEELLEGNDYITLAMLITENDTIYLDVEWGGASETQSIIIRTSGVSFVDEITNNEEDNSNKKLGISYEAVSIEGASNVNQLKAEIANMYSEDPDENGFYCSPLMAFWALGRGTYGSNLRIQFIDGNSYDGSVDPTTRMYNVNVLESTKKGIAIREHIFGMMDEDAFDEDYDIGPSLYLPDLVNDPDEGSGKIGMYFNSVTYNHMLDLANTLVDEDSEKFTVQTFDPIFGLTVTGNENDYVKMIDNTSDENYVNLIAADGFRLGAGSDGDFDMDKNTLEEVEEAREIMLIKAFEGNVDKRIKSRYSTPADFCLDAGFSDNVKRTMGAFALDRKYDCMTYLDTKLLKTATECINFLKDMNNVNGNNIVKEMHCYQYKDKLFTGKSCDMTITHWFAKAFPTHIMVNGIGEPFAKTNARITNVTDFISGTFFPIIDPDEHEIKKQIYKYGANCYETVKHNIFQRSSAITSYKVASDRVDEFNEYITQRAVKLTHDLLSSKLYHIAEDADRARFTDDAVRVLDYHLSGLVKTVSVEFVSSAADKKRNILRLRLRLTFKTVSKYGIGEVYLDPRVIEAAA